LWTKDAARLKEILFRLVNCPSISGTAGEISASEELYAILRDIPYFQANPGHLELKKIKDDKLGRYFVSALVKGKSSRTVVLLSHSDVVDIEAYGPLREYAFSPEELTARYSKEGLPEEVRKELETGEWLFGRGIMDMKSGIALQTALLHDISQIADDFDGSLLMISVPDEENNSLGMLSAVPHLLELREKHGLEYTCAVKSESHDLDKKGRHEIATGTIGKMLPFFYCFGKEAHSSSPFSGLNSNLLFSQVEAQMEKNEEFIDRFGGEFTPPPTNLKSKDLRTLYNVTIPQVTCGYYNLFTVSLPPGEIMEKLRNVAYTAFKNAMNIYRKRLKRFTKVTGLRPEEVQWSSSSELKTDWKPNVYTFQELYESIYREKGEAFVEEIDACAEKLKHEIDDEREFCTQLVHKVHSYCSDREPKIVVAIFPPYYPHVVNTGQTAGEKKVKELVDRIKEYGKAELGATFKETKFFKGISDLSYFRLHDAEEVFQHLKPNMPAINYVYKIPLEEIKKLNLPVVNIGAFGRDPHQNTERLHMPFFTEKAPHLLQFAVQELLGIQEHSLYRG